MARLRGFITSYVGLVIGSLVVILVAMNALAAAQTSWLLERASSYSLISFAPLDLADYTQQIEARSIVISFENGVAGGLREAVTSLAAAIPAVSQRLVDEARRDDQARATLASGGAFGLSADAARAVASQAVASTGIVPPPLANILAPQTPTVAPGAPPTQIAAPSGGLAPTSTGTPAVQSTQTAVPFSPTPTRTSTPTAASGESGAGGSGSAAATATSAPAGGGQAPTPVPLPPTPVPVAPTLVPTAPAASSPTVPVATAAATASAVPAPSATPLPPAPPAPSATAAPDDGASVMSGATATATVPPTATPPEFAMDLSVPGGSSVSFQPIFSGSLQMKAGESISRTVNIQNNGTRTFRYSLNTSGGSGVLWTDATNGLQMRIQKNGVDVYTGALQMADQVIGQLSRGGQDALVITVSLPSTAGNAYQSLSTTVSYNFTAVAVP